MSTPSTELQKNVLAALSTVMDPDLHRDLVSLNMIQGLEVTASGGVKFKVVLTTPACPMKAKIEADVRAALATVKEITDLQIEMTAQVRSAPKQGGIPGVQQIIAVSSGKGGVGKSTVAVNLALALALEGSKVGILDADIYGPNLPTLLGLEKAEQMVEHRAGQGDFFIPLEAHGVKAISMGFMVDPDQPMIWRGPMLHSALTQFCRNVAWGALDYLIIDLPPGTGDVQLSLAQMLPLTGAVMVTTPQEIALQDVRKAFMMWEKVQVPVLGVVENMSYFVCNNCDKAHTLFGEGGGKQLAERFHVPLLTQLPLVSAIREGGDQGVPMTVREPDSEAAQSFRRLARSVAQRVSILAHSEPGPELIQIGKFN